MVRKVIVMKLIEPSDEKFQLWMDQVDAMNVIVEKNGLFDITREWDPESYTVRVEWTVPKESNFVNTLREINIFLSKVGVKLECVMTDDICHPRQKMAQEALDWLNAQEAVA